MNEIILQNKDGKVLVSSRDVAKHFNKKHSEVIYAIEGRIGKDGTVKNNGILMSGNSQLSQMFIKTEYKDSMNRMKYEYLMNRDGFSLLCMGFTGQEALEWKLKYIEAFNKMEETIKSGTVIHLPVEELGDEVLYKGHFKTVKIDRYWDSHGRKIYDDEEWPCQVLKDVDDIGIVRLSHRDVVRHELVQAIVRAYEKHSQKNERKPYNNPRS